MKYKYLSETWRNGEPEDHRIATLYLRDNLQSEVLTAYRYQVIKDFPFEFPNWFVEEKQLPHNKHKADLAIVLPDPFKDCVECGDFRELLGVIEVVGKTGFEVTLPDGTKIKGSPTKHDNTQQKINDGIFKDYIDTRYPKALFYYIEKGDCFDIPYCSNLFGNLISRLKTDPSELHL